MQSYNKYLIKDDDKFDPEYFASINDEVDLINKRVAHVPGVFKSEILVSFLKDHSLQHAWINSNPQLVDLVTSGSLFTGNIESLFDSCRGNSIFRLDLEVYLAGKFTHPN